MNATPDMFAGAPAGTPAPPAPALDFRRLDDYAQVTVCRRYTVSAAKVRGRWTFHGWLRGFPAVLLTPYRVTDAEQAREACRKHMAGVAQAVTA